MPEAKGVISTSRTNLLHKLARSYGVQTAYYGMAHRRQQASAESLLAVLQALGAPVETFNEVASAWRHRQQQLWQRVLEPVTVAWDGEPVVIEVRLPSWGMDALLAGHLTLESGEMRNYEWPTADLPVKTNAEIEGLRYVVKEFPLPDRLPWGYHWLTLEISGLFARTLIIVAPVKAGTIHTGLGNRAWGIFAPLYGLKTEASWGSGDFTSMEAIIKWVAQLGGHVVATLPLLATFYDRPFEPSPYAPVSRLLWNEFYLDIARVPELQECPAAQAFLASSSFQTEVEALRRSPLVDYRRQMALKRQVLEELCRCLFDKHSERQDALHRFEEMNPLVAEYARFRATLERQGRPCQTWPERLRKGNIEDGDYDEKSRRYHLYVQWLTRQQVLGCFERAQQKGVQLYLDLPLGVHPDGYDVWRNGSTFALNVSVGAPPDAVFTNGQNWGFPPQHPDEVRTQGYGYTIAYLRHHLRHAGILRIDHVMGLHRLYWIPAGMPSSKGVYVRYKAEETYAILALESQRHGCILVGEDLGTVPPEVRPAMNRHGLHRMYVLHYELKSDKRRAFRRVAAHYVASINTHDMPPFAALWRGLDIEGRQELGLLDKASAKREWQARHAIQKALVDFLKDKGWIKEPAMDDYAVLKACLAFMSASRARIVLVNLEDLWLETQPQNIPSTTESYPNWQHKLRYTFEEFCQMPHIANILQEVNRLRKPFETDFSGAKKRHSR